MRPVSTTYDQLLVCVVMATLLCAGLCATPTAAEEPALRVVVHGIEGAALDNVKAALSLPAGLVHEGEVNKPWLKYFEGEVPATIRKALEPFGYFSPKASTSLEATGERSYVLSIQVEPGERVRVEKITVAVEGAGAREKALASLAEGFPLKKGDVLLQGKYEEAKGVLKAKAMELGYLDAEFTVHEIRVFESELKAVIDLKLDTGPRYFFDNTSFEGAAQYDDPFVRRYLAYKPDDVFSYVKLSETQLNLINSERFKNAVVIPERQDARDLHIPVRIKLEPSEPKRFRIGVGYGTDTGPRVTISFRDLNVFGTGHEFSAMLNLSQKLQGFGANYIIPDDLDINSYAELKLNLRREDVTTYTNKLLSLEADRSRSFGKGQLISFYLRAQKENFEVGQERGNSRLILPGVRMSGRRFDSLLRPKDAYRYEIDVHGTHRFIGSNASFVQVVAEGDRITPLPWRLSLLTRVKAGATFQEDTIDKLPASMRFFAGGDKSVRGYSYQSLGPKDAAGNVVGGRYIFVGSVELERALFSDWGIAAFYDLGNAFNSLSSITLFQGAGIGIRYYTKIGRVKVDVARQLGINNPGFRLHFNVGAEF